jgi:hypothetical protein
MDRGAAWENEGTGDGNVHFKFIKYEKLKLR